MDNGHPPTRVSYRDLWYAAVGVVEMCARDDKGGRAIGLGKHPFSDSNVMNLSLDLHLD